MDKNQFFMLFLGNRIKHARVLAGVTQEDLANHLGVSRTTIARYELGEIEPKLKNLVAISEYLNISTDALLGIERENTTVDIANLPDDAIKALNKFIKTISKY